MSTSVADQYRQIFQAAGFETVVRPLARTVPKPEETGVVYFVAGPDRKMVKIGWTRAGSPENRIKALQTANPDALTLVAAIVGTARDEKEFHRRFDHLRVRGEWFRVEADLALFLERSR